MTIYLRFGPLHGRQFEVAARLAEFHYMQWHGDGTASRLVYKPSRYAPDIYVFARSEPERT